MGWTIGFVETIEHGCPSLDFLNAAALPPKKRAEMVRVLEAVRDAPPYSFPGGGKWEAMRGEMVGFHEVRARRGDTLYRLICRLERASRCGDMLSVVSGLTKRNRTAADPNDYAFAREVWEAHSSADAPRWLALS